MLANPKDLADSGGHRQKANRKSLRWYYPDQVQWV